MRFYSIIALTGVAAIALGLSGCDGKDEAPDVSAPAMTIVQSTPQLSVAEVCGSMSNRVMAIPVDGSIQLKVRYTDNAGLAQAKFDLHSNFDCHGHGKLEDQTVWQVLEIVGLDGTEVELERTFTPPANVRPGDYHLGLMCVDAAGNEAAVIYFDVKVFDAQDTVPPVISLDSPMEGSSYSRSQPLVISGVVTDDVDMGLGEVMVTLFDANGAEFNIVRHGFGAEVGSAATFQFEYAFPGSFASGQCSVRVEATDRRNNFTSVSRGFAVTE